MDSSELDNKRKEHLLGGGQERQQDQRKKGKMTAFERINTLFDPESFEEIDAFVTHDCHDFGMENKRSLYGFWRISGIVFCKQNLQNNGTCFKTRSSNNRY